MISGSSVLSTGEVFLISLLLLLDLFCLLGCLLLDFLLVPVLFVTLLSEVEAWVECLDTEGEACTTFLPSWGENSSIKFAKTGIS